ncbi:MAG: peptide-aspartate beta-dioxygenase [Euryarchaeota archaeon]|nr:peptide-aspartate beta-dioxygenase [Euryarchaeota archaeon]
MPKGFYVDPDLKFDINKMQSALKEVDSRVARQSPLGERDINAICLTQIPGDANSITGGNVRGLFWTKPDSTYDEVQREEPIDETKYSEFVKLFEDTYFKDVYDAICKKYKIGRIRLLWKLPRTTLSWHRDPEPRLHIPIVTNYGARMCIDNVVHHMPADGSTWITDNTKYHNAFNGGEEDRVHLVATVLNFDMAKF